MLIEFYYRYGTTKFFATYPSFFECRLCVIKRRENSTSKSMKEDILAESLFVVTPIVQFGSLNHRTEIGMK